MKRLYDILWIIAILSASLLCACHGHGNRVDALPFCDGGRWGLADTDGQTLCPAGSLPAQPSAVVNGMFTMPDSDGRLRLYRLSAPHTPASTRTFHRIGHFLEHDVAPAQESEGAPVLFIDRKGNTVASTAQYPQYDIRLVHNFSDGRALFRTGDGKWGYMDTKGRVAIAPLYDQAYDFAEELALTAMHNAEGEAGYSIIDRKGNVVGTVTQPGCLLDTRFSGGRLMFTEQESGRSGYMDRQGSITAWLPEGTQTASRTEHKPMAMQDTDGRFFFINADGRHKGEPHDTIATDLHATGAMPQTFVCGKSPESKPDTAIIASSLRHEAQPADSLPASATGRNKEEQIPSAIAAPEDTDWRNISRRNPFYREAAKVISGKLPEDDAHNRHMILNYVEHLRTSYTTKDIDFLRQLFSEKALIIVGKVIKTAARAENGYMPPARVIYNVKSKQQYMERLEAVFKANQKIEVSFSDFRIMRHPTMPGIYGVTLRQGYRSDLYSDDGYLFLLWDFRDKTAPKIHVRTWQPSTTDGHRPLPADSVFGISDFNLE